MSVDEGGPLYTYKGAAKKVGRSEGRIKQWRREGMKVEVDAKGRVVVRHSVLMDEFRQRIARDPVQQIRTRRALEEHEEHEEHEAAGLDSRAPNPPSV